MFLPFFTIHISCLNYIFPFRIHLISFISLYFRYDARNCVTKKPVLLQIFETKFCVTLDFLQISYKGLHLTFCLILFHSNINHSRNGVSRFGLVFCSNCCCLFRILKSLRTAKTASRQLQILTEHVWFLIIMKKEFTKAISIIVLIMSLLPPVIKL